MVLKDAFHYQNCISNWISDAERYLSKSGFVVSTKEQHLRSKANPDAVDETIEVKSSVDVDFTPTDVINLVVKLINEKTKLAEAITKTKASLPLDIDSTLALNKIRQEYILYLNTLASNKSSEIKDTALGYKLDVEGKQTTYRYDVKRVQTINYDRDNVRKLAKKLKNQCDSLSMEIDRLMVTAEVNFVPAFDVLDTIEDILES